MELRSTASRDVLPARPGSPWIVVIVSAASANVGKLVARPRSASRSPPGAGEAGLVEMAWAQLQTRAAARLPIGEPAVDRDELRRLLPAPAGQWLRLH